MVEIKGDINKALGVGEMQIGDLTIDISDVTAKQIIDYQKIIAKKYHEEDMRFTDLTSFFERLLSNGKEDENIKKLVALNFSKLTAEFGIAIGLLSREKIDQAVKEQEQKLKENSKKE